MKARVERELDLQFTRSILVKMLQQPFIVFYVLELFQIRSELERTLKIPDCTKAMKEAFRETWRPRLLTLLKNSDNKAIVQIVNVLEDDEGEIMDVKGNKRF